MRADSMMYRKAATTGLTGLVIQSLLAILCVVYALLSRDHAGMSTAIFTALGILAWLTLTILYDQHRRERIEAIEVESLAQAGGASASVFSTSDEMRPAAKRLGNMHKFVVPAVSLLLAGLLLGLGFWRLWGVLHPLGDAGPLYSPDQFVRPTSMHSGWAMALGGIPMGVVGFILARYAAGLSKQPVWANLRGGAAFSVGAAMLGLAMAIAHLIKQVGSDAPLRYLQVVVPCFMMLVGAEILLNFVLSIYRPRRAGEIPRAAFDSRLLGFAAAPDTVAKSISDAINYQLGFDVSGGWFYQILSRSVLPLLLGGLLVVWLLSSLAVVQPHQRAMVLRFGKPIGQELPPGLHVKAPWPIDRLYVPEFQRRDEKGVITGVDRTVTGLRTLSLGTTSKGNNEAILWTNDHPGDEVFQFVRASKEQSREAGTSGELVDLAMVSAEIPLHFVVEDVKLFDELAAFDQREGLLKAIAVREATRYFQGTALDEVLGYGRQQISEALRDRVQRAFDGLNPGPDGKPRGAGVRVVYVGIAGVHPPKAAATSFEAPVQADARRIANIQNAEADAISTLTEVVGNAGTASKIVTELEALDRLRSKGSGATSAQVTEQQLKVQRMIIDAGGAASSTLAEARAQRWVKHNSARADLARYAGQVAMFEASPPVFMMREYLSALNRAVGSSRLYIMDSGTRGSWMQLNLEDKTIRAETFGATGEADQ
jgi:modulator of FtsH protease HflK